MVSMSVLHAVADNLAQVFEVATPAWQVFLDGFAGSIVAGLIGAIVTVLVFRRTLNHATREADKSRDESRAALRMQLDADFEARRHDRLVAATAEWMTAAEGAIWAAGKFSVNDSHTLLMSAMNRVRMEIRHDDDELAMIVLHVTGRIIHLGNAVPEWDADSNDDDKAAREGAKDAVAIQTMQAVEHLMSCVSAPRGSPAHETARSLLRELSVEPD